MRAEPPTSPARLPGRGAILAILALSASAACDPPPSPPPAGSAPAAPESAAPPASAAPASSEQVGPTVDPPEPEREIAGAAHVLIAFKGSLGAPKTITRTKADAKKRAEEAHKKLVDKKATFEELVKQYSDDELSLKTEGKIGNFERGVMAPAFESATFALKVDEVSEVVETSRGFHIIRRTK